MASAIYDTETVATPDPIDDGTRGPGRQQRARDPVRPPDPLLALGFDLGGEVFQELQLIVGQTR
jgi:hypothetical protein